jgi:K+-transporting ATPase KdpF subunit
MQSARPGVDCNLQAVPLPAGGLRAIGARHGPCNLPGMNLEYGIGLALAALLTVYLVYALLKPESF